jgi:predicted O-methyltransferase YrrM
MGLMRRLVRALRIRTRGLRHQLQGRLRRTPIQRTAPLLPGDQANQRKRWHVLVDLLNEQCPGEGLVVVEIGTYSGYTSAHLLRYVPRIEHIYAVDIRKPEGPIGNQIAGEERATFIQGWSHEAAEHFDDASLDLVFIDADHSQEAVARDLLAWVPKVKPGGVIAGHDYGSHSHPGVKVAVDGFFHAHPNPVHQEDNRVWWTLR